MTTSSKSGSPLNPKLVRELAEILRETELTEIEVEKGDLRLRVARTVQAAPVMHSMAAPAPVAAAPAAAPAAPASQPSDPAQAPEGGDTPGSVPSPMVGTVYLRPNPEADAFAKAGDTVKEGDTILLIEAMKTFNPITAPRSGKLTHLFVTDAQPVEYGEALFAIS